jgi:hypothetical protein
MAYTKTMRQDMNQNNLEIVIARYKENLDWAKSLKYKINIFNKNEDDYALFENNLPNVGREGHTHFKYIIDNFDNLPQYIAFLQGHPFDHCHDVIDKINNFNFNIEFMPLGNTIELTRDIPSINEQIYLFSKTIGFELKYPVYCVPGAQYIISSNIIKQKPIEFYKKIISLLDKEIYPHAVLDVEKTLFQIYNIAH